MLKRQLFSIVCLSLALSFDGIAQDIQKDTLKLSLYFKTGATNPTIESRQNIERAMSVIPSGTDIEGVVIEGWASPEGSVELNARIANHRAATAESFLREYFPLPDNVRVNGQTDWKGLMHYCSKYFAAEDMDRIAATMKLPVENRKPVLTKLDGGRLWKEMDSEVFPLLRRADITIIYYRHNTEGTKRVYSDAFATYTEYTTKGETVSRTDTVVIYHKDTVYYLPVNRKRDPIKVQALYPKIDRHLKRPVVAFRTNLLLPLLNVGVECPISNRWSVAADFYYPWIPRDWMNKWSTPQMNCIQAVGGYVEGRYWLGVQHREKASYGKYRLLGHSLGVIGGAAYYDLERNGAGQQGELYTIGLGYTYALPLGRTGAVHMEFDIAAGVVYHSMHPYDVRDEGGYLLRRKDESNVGIVAINKWMFYPIRAGISLVVPIFTDKPLKAKGKR